MYVVFLTSKVNIQLRKKLMCYIWNIGKTKIDGIRSQQIRESCGIQLISQWVERRREWDEHVTRMDAGRLVKMSRDNIPAGRRSPGCPKRRWSDD